MKSRPLLLQLEKTHMQQQRPSAVKNLKKKISWEGRGSEKLSDSLEDSVLRNGKSQDFTLPWSGSKSIPFSLSDPTPRR